MVFHRFQNQRFLLEFHHDVYACRNFQLLQSLGGLLCRTYHVDQTLVCTTLELLTAVLVLVSCTQDCDDLLIGREWDRTRNLRTTSLCCLYDLSCCCIYSCMLIALDLDSDFFVVCLCTIGGWRIASPSGTFHAAGCSQHLFIKKLENQRCFRAGINSSTARTGIAVAMRN